MILDIIIPTLNEAGNLDSLLPYLQLTPDSDKINIVVVDAASSTDKSELICDRHHVQYLRSNSTQRSSQLNLGVSHVGGNILMFLHADVRPPENYYRLILSAISAGYQSGSFAYKFNNSTIVSMLRFNSFFSQFKGWFTGGGDQAQFITRDCFEALGGFSEDHVIMEDFELYDRIKSNNISYTIIKNRAQVSARKYENNSWLRVNLVNLIAFIKYKADQDPRSIRSFYQKWLKA